MIVCIDGPAGSGKSSTAKDVARRLGFRHLDSGAFYRALTLALLRTGTAPETWPALDARALDALGVHATAAPEGFALLIGNDNVNDEIRGEAVTGHVALVASVPAVREWLLDRLRSAADGVDLVADGRDMGTVVFPDADVKVFLVADPAERARRRLRERGVEHPDADALRAEADRLQTRDAQDMERDVAPLRRADDAIEIDTTRLGFDEQVTRIVSLVEERRR